MPHDLNQFSALFGGMAVIDCLNSEGEQSALRKARQLFGQYSVADMVANRDHMRPVAIAFLERHGFFGSRPAPSPPGYQPPENPDRMSFQEVKSRTTQMMEGRRITDLPQDHQLLVAAILGSSSEREALVQIRKGFYKLPNEMRFNLVKAAFDDETGPVGIMRQLIEELPEDQQAAILGTRQLPSR